MNLIKNALNAGLVAGILMSSAVAQSVVDARKAIDAEQYQKAKTILKSLISAKPDEAENYYYLGNVYLLNEYTDSAKTVYSKGIAADDKFPLNYVGLGAVDLQSNKAAEAKANFEKAIDLAKRKDNDPYIFIAKALIAAPQPDYNTAITYLEKAKEIDDKDSEVYLALGDAYRGLKKNGEAYSAYRTAFDLDKTFLRPKVELGVLNKISKAFKESADELNSVIAINPNYGPAYRELAETYLQWSFGENNPQVKKERLDKAIQYYKKYMDLTDRSSESRLRYAGFLVYANDFKNLEQEAKALIANNKNVNPRAYRYLGYAAYENGNYAESVKAINNFISKVEPSRLIPSDYFYLGKAQYKMGDSTAFTNLTIAVEKDSTLAEELSELANDAFKEKKYGDAAKLYELAVKAPQNSHSLSDQFYIGYSYYFDYAAKTQAKENPSKELLAKADSAFSKVNQLAPSYPLAYLYRARTNRYLDDEQNPKGMGIPFYEKYVEVLGEKPENLTDPKYKNELSESYNNIGAFYLRSNPAKAKEYFNKTLSVDPANAYASEVIKSLEGSK